MFKINRVLLNLFICGSWKIQCITFYTKTLSNCFNIDNNQKCFLSIKSAYYYDFWRSCDTEDWSNDDENTALITGINYILIYIHIENYFWSNKCCLLVSKSDVTGTIPLSWVIDTIIIKLIGQVFYKLTNQQFIFILNINSHWMKGSEY